MRKLITRWLVRATYEALEPVHLGGAEPLSLIEQPLVARPDRPGEFPFFGSGVAGWLRERAMIDAAGYRSPEIDPRAKTDPQVETNPLVERVQHLFGGAQGDRDGTQSALVVHDTVLRATAAVVDRIAIDPDTRVAADGAKWEVELIVPGATFKVWAELQVFDGDDEDQLLAVLDRALRANHTGIGAGTRRGAGEVALQDIRAQRIDFTDREQVMSWHQALLKHSPDEGPFPLSDDAPDALAPYGQPEKRSQRVAVEVTIPVTFPDGILVGAEDPTRAPDTVALQIGGRHYLPGWSAGGFRQAARRAASVVEHVEVEVLFGPERPEAGTIAAGDVLDASRIAIRSAVLEGAAPVETIRVRLDDFTGGAIDGALFDTEVLFGAQADLRLCLEVDDAWDDSQRARACLSLLGLAWDTCLGAVTFGGDVAVGRGRPSPLSGGAVQIRVVSPAGEGPLRDREEALMIDGKGRIDGEGLREWVDQLRELAGTGEDL